MTRSTDHLDDELLSDFVDAQLSASELSEVQGHLAACEMCGERLDGLRSVVTLLRGLPELDPPRSFALRPRIVADPPNVVRLRRWYSATRISAASLAALFVVLSAGALYEDTRPVPVSAPAAAAVARPQLAAPPVLTESAPPTAAPRSLVVPAGAARPAQQPQPDDQVAAATSINPLPTPVPTPTLVPAAASTPRASAVVDAGLPWRVGAASVGILAVLTLLSVILLRHRLKAASS